MTTFFLEAFGRLTPGTAVIMAEEEDLYSVFYKRAELMHWSNLMFPRPPYPLLWEMHEAELTDGSPSGRIGYVQVGMSGDVSVPGSEAWPPTGPIGYTALPTQRRYPVDSVAALPALNQCFLDALRRFGDVTLSGVQVTIHDRQPPPHAGSRRGSNHNWFNLTPRTRTAARIAFDHALLGEHTAAVLAAHLQAWHKGSFTFGSVVTVPPPHAIQVAPEAPFSSALVPASLGVAVTLPEWTASAIAWVLALVLDAAHRLAPDVRHCAVRVTRAW